MKKRIFLPLLFNFIVCCPIYASVYIKQPIEKYIEKAQLIVKGTVIKKQAKKEEHLLKQYSMKNGVLSENRTAVNAVFTTFTVKIDEVLYGSHDKENIEIKMLGGCNDKGSCFRLSSNYDFEINSNVLLFLNFDPLNNFFHSTSNGITAYLVHKNGQLVKAGEFLEFDNKNSVIQEIQNVNSLSVEQLKRKIEGVRSEN